MVLLAAAITLIYVTVQTPHQPNQQLDSAFVRLPWVCILAIGVALLGQLEPLRSSRALMLMLCAHVLYVVVAGFLLRSLDLLNTVFGQGLRLYALVGTVVLIFALWAGQDSAPLVSGWVFVSLVAMGATFAGLVMKLKKDASPRSFMVAAGGLWGLALVVDGLLVDSPQTLSLQVMHFFYFAYLVFLWLELTSRLHWVQWHREHPPVGAASGFAHPSGFSRVTDMASVQESATAAVEHERHRIAQDIHDGVGSHLVGLIASLDPNSPLHRRIMMGLECCLLDLKMTVDSMDNSESNIFDALGRLRYRLQPSLQRAGIKMVWKVDVAGALVAVRPAEITHLMHIVQECLSNVLVHSHATKVRLQCRYELEPEPCLFLEVQDNGVGITKRDPKEFVGKGLSGMRERAKLLGVPLHISTQAGVGTRVRIYLPVRSASPRAQADALAQAH